MAIIEDRRADARPRVEVEPPWLDSVLDLDGELLLAGLFDGAPPGPEEIADWRQALAGVDLDLTGTVSQLSEPEHLDRIRRLEDLKAAAAAAQAVLTMSFDRTRRNREADEGVPANRRGKGVSAEIALARRLSPHQGGRQLGLARKIVAEMPHTLAVMRTGELSERRAGLIATETQTMDASQRAQLDEALCADSQRLASWGDKRLVAEARRAAYELSPDAMAERTRRAPNDRHVTLRPASNAMMYVSALLPAAQAIACYAALTQAADSARVTGDPRGKGQLMADTLVERVTGQYESDAVPVAVQLVMSDHALFAGSGEAAVLPGYGTVPAQWARDLVARALQNREDARTGVRLRRLFTHPASGQLVAMDSRSRFAPAGLRDFVTLRDGATCRTPYCDAPIRHIDHIQPHAKGGSTSEPNLEGLCERCNYIKSLPAWQLRLEGVLDRLPSTGPPGTGPPSTISRGAMPVTTTTPTGHGYTSRPPPTIGQ